MSSFVWTHSIQLIKCCICSASDSPTESMQEIERRNLAAAMAESLEENNIRKAAETPLHELENKELLLRYKDSCILKEVTRLLISMCQS